MEKIKSHKDLTVYQKAMDHVVNIYTLTRMFPSEEKFGLSNQMRRAAVSIPSNIAEGAARRTTKEYIQFLYIAMGSVSELETQIVIAVRLKYIQEAMDLLTSTMEIKRMHVKLVATLTAKI